DSAIAPRRRQLPSSCELRWAHRGDEQRQIVKPSEPPEAVRRRVDGEIDELVFGSQHPKTTKSSDGLRSKKERFTWQHGTKAAVGVKVQLDGQRIAAREKDVMVLTERPRVLLGVGGAIA